MAENQTQGSPLILDLSKLPDQSEPLTLDASQLPDQPDPQEQSLKQYYVPQVEKGFQSVAEGLTLVSTESSLQKQLVGEFETLSTPQPPRMADARDFGGASIARPKPEQTFMERYSEAIKGAKTDEEYAAALIGQVAYDAWKRVDPKLNSAKAMNAIALSHLYNVSPSFAIDNYDALNSMRDQPPPHAFIPDIAMGAAGVTGLGVGVPLSKMVLGLAGFTAAEEMNALVRSFIQGTKFSETKPYSLMDLTPKESGELTQTALSILDMVAKGKALHAGYKGLGQAWDALTVQTIIENGGPSRVYVDPEKISRIFGTKGISSEELQLWVDWDVTAAELREAKLGGFQIELPIKRVIKSTDTPLISRIKKAFNINPYSETRVETVGKRKFTPIAGLLEEPGKQPPVEPAKPPGVPAEPLNAKAEPAIPKPPTEEPKETLVDRAQSGKLPGGEIPSFIVAASAREGIDANTALTIASVESRFVPTAKNPSSSAYGLFQFVDSTWLGMGGTAENRGDIAKQVELGVKFIAQNTRDLTRALGRTPEPWEVYMAHQQGAAGAERLLKNPEQNAVSLVGRDAVLKNGGTEEMTAGEFTSMWSERFNKRAGWAGLPNESRRQFADALRQNPGLAQEEKDSLLSKLDDRAEMWAEREDRTPAEWYDRFLAGKRLSEVQEEISKFQTGAPTSSTLALRPSVIVDSVQYNGEPGQKHNEVLAANNLPAGTEQRGFVAANGEFMTREEAKAWVQKNQPAAYRMLPEGEMHAEPYAEAVGKSKAALERQVRLTSLEDRSSFNEVMSRLGGKALSPRDSGSRGRYKKSLSPEETEAYDIASRLWNEYDGNVDAVHSALDSQILRSEAERGYVEESRRARRELEKQGQLRLPAPTRGRQRAKAEETPAVPAGGRGVVGAPGVEPTGFTTIGKAFQDIERNPVPIVGQQINSAADLAELAQQWRNPNYEELRYIFVKDGVVLDHEGVTCRAVSSSRPFVEKTFDEGVQHIKDRIASLGADSLYLVHNHPSGDPTASMADRHLQMRFSGEIPELREHIIIDSGKYGIISRNGSEFIIADLPSAKAEDWVDPILTPSLEHEALGSKIRGSEEAAKWAKSLTMERKKPILVYLDAELRIRGLQEIDPEAVDDLSETLRQVMPRKLMDFGSVRCVLASPTGEALEYMEKYARLVADGVLLDVSGMDERNRLYSAAISYGISDAAAKLKVFGGRPESAYEPISVKEEESEYNDLLDLVKTGDEDLIAASLDRLVSLEEAMHNDALHRLNSEYEKIGLPRGQVRAEDIKEYDQLIAEANKRAWEELQKEELKLKAKQEREVRKQAETEYENYKQGYLPKIVEDVRKGGGIKHSSLSDYDKDTLRHLTKRFPGLISKKGAFSLDELAANLQFENDDALMSALLDLPTKGEFIENYIYAWEKEYGKASGFEAAEWQSKLIDKQLEVFNELLKGSVRDWENRTTPGIKKVIREITGQVKVSGVMVNEYDALKAGIRKAERASRDAFKAGKLEESVRQKQRQKLLLDMYKAKIQAKKDSVKALDRINRVLKSFEKNQKLSQDYRDALAHLLRPVEKKLKLTLPKIETKSKNPLFDAMQKAIASGDLASVDAEEIYGLRGRDFSNLDVDDLKDLATASRILLKLARLEDQLLTVSARKSFSALISDLVNKVKETAYGRGTIDIVTPTDRLEQDADKKSEQNLLTKLHFSLRRTEFLNRDLDGWKYLGIHFDEIDLKIQGAAQAWMVLKDAINERYLKAHEEFEKEVGMPTEKWFRQKVMIPGRTRPITRDQAWSAWACTHNEANLRTVMLSDDPRDPSGKTGYYTEEQLAYIDSIMTDAERKLFLEHAEHFASFKERIWALSMDLTGTHPKEVEGIYWPIVLDPKMSMQTEAIISRSATQDLFKSAFDSPVVPSPFRKIRTGTKRPANLSYSWILPRLQQQAKWLAYAKAIRDVQKIVTNPLWADAVINSRGRAFYDQYMPYLQDLANPMRNMSFSPIDKAIDVARRVTVMHYLAGYVNTSIKHFFEWIPSAARLGFFNNMRGFVTFGSSFPRSMISGEPNAFQTINGLSVQMAHSAHSADRDIQDFMAAIEGYPKWQRFLMNHAMDLIRLTDIIMRYSTWIEAYNQAMDFRGKGGKLLMKALFDKYGIEPGQDVDVKVSGLSPEQHREIAIDFADAIIRLTKAVPGTENLPMFGRGPGFGRLAFTLGQYLNTVFNAVIEDFARVRWDPNYSIWDFMKAIFLLMVVAPLMTESAVKRKVPKDVEEGLLFMGEYAASLNPIMRGIVGTSLYAYEHATGRRVQPQMLPGLDFANNFANAFLDGLNYATGKPVSQRWMEDVMETIGTFPTTSPFGGFPPEQAIIFARGWLDYRSGKSDTLWSLLDRRAKYHGEEPSARRSRFGRINMRAK